jgi:hypothetical protein
MRDSIFEKAPVPPLSRFRFAIKKGQDRIYSLPIILDTAHQEETPDSNDGTTPPGGESDGGGGGGCLIGALEELMRP